MMAVAVSSSACQITVRIVPNPYKILQTTAQTTAAQHSRVVRILACLIMAGVMLQSCVSPSQQFAARAHFHIITAVEKSRVTLDHVYEKPEQDPANGDADADAETQSHPHPHAHGHSHPATHEHSSDRNDVVYADTNDSEPPSGQASHRIALDLDWLLLQMLQPSVDVPIHAAFAALVLRFRSRVVPPLERPPRVGA